MPYTDDHLGTSLVELNHIIKTLRSPSGCPWDRKQTAESIKKHLLEETYEVLDAIDQEQPKDICSELGDLLMQIYFLALIYEERNLFTLLDISETIQEKLIRRHPHVFAGQSELSDDQINQQWEQIKAIERQQTQSHKTHQPTIEPLPALLAAQKWEKKYPHPPLSIEEISQQFFELENTTNHSTVETIIGKLLANCVRLAEHHQVDAETSLRQYLINTAQKTE